MNNVKPEHMVLRKGSTVMIDKFEFRIHNLGKQFLMLRAAPQVKLHEVSDLPIQQQIEELEFRLNKLIEKRNNS